ncbi:helicase C-terminal domain-containing protein [Sulfurimonas sp.]|uniref:helicase C-terminal domain-containing protein n=1 Tax=Sulfurimonas sp. TaxID=2022749 RepID=UPI0025FD2EB4|nr:helicase C-terminal domain-containing protein [Sulfurimonas sp.]
MLISLWNKVESFIGLSATLKTNPDSISERDNASAFARLGVTKSTYAMWEKKVQECEEYLKKRKRVPLDEKEDDKQLVQFLNNQRKGYKEGWLSQDKEDILIEKFDIVLFKDIPKGDKIETKKKEDVEHIKYGVVEQPLVFSREQARVFIPHKDLVKPALKDSENEVLWFSMIVNTIAKNYNEKATLVICGSFYEVEQISSRLKTLLPNENIISAERNRPTSQVVAQFKKESGIMIGTRNYGTGLNLPKKQLEKEFIVKLPFPVFNTKKWLDIKEQDKKNNTSFYQSTYKNEMILNFRQWIGRLIRTKDDKGDLYILDGRYNDTRYMKTLKFWLERMGIIQKDLIIFDEENCQIKLSQDGLLKEFINSLDCEDDIKSFYHENIEKIKSTKKLPLALGDTFTSEFKTKCRELRQEIGQVSS